MESPNLNSKHDALDELLRRYLLEKDESGLMEANADAVFADPPKVIPSAAREADMIKRLQQRFPERQRPPVRARRNLLRRTLFATGGLALACTLLLLWLDPLSGVRANNQNTKRNNELIGEGTSGKAGDGSTAHISIHEHISLLEGTGNPDNLHPQHKEQAGHGDRERSSNVHPWLPSNGGRADGLPTHPDPRSVSPSLFGPIAPAPTMGPTMVEPIDPFPLRALYAQTSSQSRYYLLEPEKDHLIRSKKGTLLHIPKDAFVDALSGKPVTEMIQVEFKEVFKRSDFLKTNLPTVSNGQQLVSGGVIYFDAISAGRRLAVAKGKDIFLEFAPEHSTDIHDMQLYAGDFNKRGEMNWNAAAASTARMVSLDLDQLYFDEFYCDCKGEKLWNNLLWAISDKDFANSWIATREFRQRLHALAELNYFSRGLIAYRDNVEKDLWKVDKMVASMLREQIGQGLAKEEEVARFEAFSAQGLTQAESFDDHGVDLSKPDARRQLLYRSVSRDESERLIRIDRLRREYAEEIADRLVIADNGVGTYVVRVKPGQPKGSPRRGIKAFYVRQLGWASIHKSLDQNHAHAKTSEVKVRLTGEVPYESTRTFLVYQDMLSLLPGSLTTGQLFRFKDVLRGSDAKIVAIGFKDGLPYLGIESLPRESGEPITVAMRRLQIDDYMDALAALD
jgi:uncharacterized protein YciU (UPF0263 family)